MADTIETKQLNDPSITALPDDVDAGALVFNTETGKAHKAAPFRVADKTKLDGVAVGATANISDSVSAARMDTKDTAVIAALRDGVAGAGDTLAKLYALFQTLNTIVTSTTPDGNAFTDTIQEVLALFASYPEGVDIATTLAGKINATALVNALTQTAAGGVLDARQGKVLNDLISALTTIVGQKANSADLAEVATTGSYNDLLDVPAPVEFDPTQFQTADADLTAIAALTPNDGDIIQRVAGGWLNRTIAQLKTALGLTGTNSGDQDLSGYATNASLATKAPLSLTLNDQTASYTLVLTDAGKLVRMNVGTANNLTIPLNSAVAFLVGTQISVTNLGAGQTSVVGTGGVTINSAGGALKLRVQYSTATLIKTATDTWLLTGDTTA